MKLYLINNWKWNQYNKQEDIFLLKIQRSNGSLSITILGIEMLINYNL